MQDLRRKSSSRNAEQFFKNYAELFFDSRMPKGGVVRKINMGDLRKFNLGCFWENIWGLNGKLLLQNNIQDI